MSDLKYNIIYQMKCEDFLDQIEYNQAIDLAVLDPPYNLNKASWDTFKTERDFFDYTFSYLDKLLPKLKANASLYIFNTPYNAAKILSFLTDKKMIFQNWITWDKRDGIGNAKTKFSPRSETILFLTKGSNHTFNRDDVRIPYETPERVKSGILKNGKRWFPHPNGRLCGDVWHITSARHQMKVNGRTQKLNHMTPKPLNMLERIVRASSNENDIVFDGFAGSGTTAIAAKLCNRRFLGCDISEEYAAFANERLAKISVSVSLKNVLDNV